MIHHNRTRSWQQEIGQEFLVELPRRLHVQLRELQLCLFSVLLVSWQHIYHIYPFNVW